MRQVKGSTVGDLNESIYRVTVSSAEEWGKLKSPQSTGRIEVDPASQLHLPVSVQLARGRDLTGPVSLLPIGQRT